MPAYASITGEEQAEMNRGAKAGGSVLTIGHSNHTLEHFVHLLKAHGVEAVAEVRSYPYSNYSPQFDRETLRAALAAAGVMYVDLGAALGGRPEGEEFYDERGHVLYDRVARTAAFLSGLRRLQEGMAKYRIAMLCSEENPAVCHRKLLIARVLAERGVQVEHIRGDGRVQSDAEVSAESGENGAQMGLFAGEDITPWKSIPSVLRKRRPNNSSGS